MSEMWGHIFKIGGGILLDPSGGRFVPIDAALGPVPVG